MTYGLKFHVWKNYENMKNMSNDIALFNKHKMVLHSWHLCDK